MTIADIYKIFLAHPLISTDTRDIKKESIFVALKGGNFDGNNYVDLAIEKGCAYAITSNSDATPHPQKIYVSDTLKTLQELAKFHRNALNTPIVAITGTNGKTTTKELLNAALSAKYNTLATIGNLNNQIGVPLTLLKLTPQHQVAIIEMGASHIGDIKELVEIAEPNYGIITNIGKAHLQGFKNLDGVIKTKGELYHFLRQTNGKIFIRREDDTLQSISKGIDRVEYGFEGEGIVTGCVVEGNSPYLSVNVSAPNGEMLRVDTNLIGNYNISNILAAIAVGVEFNVPFEGIVKSISEYTPTNNRSQFIKGERNSIILDSYNANPTSMRAAIENLAIGGTENKMLILGDMLELGADSVQEHSEITNLITSFGFSSVVLLGEEFAASNSGYTCFRCKDSLVAYLAELKPSGLTILVKGSRGMRLESLLPYL